MRPIILFPLFAAMTTLKGVGPRMGSLFERLCGGKCVDLLWHLPSGVIDRSYSPELRVAEKGRVATLSLHVDEHIPSPKHGKPHRVLCNDGTADITISYFTAKGDYLERLFPLDCDVIVSGNLERFGRGWSMSHPDYVLLPPRRSEIPLYEPIYPLTEGLTRRKVGHAVGQVLSKLPDLPEWHDPALMKREGWLPWREALQEVHHPNATTLDENLRRRLAYDELLADQLALAIMRGYHKKAKGRVIKSNGAAAKKLLDSLPFSLTEGQKQALVDIKEDMESPHRMLRLLQGDVGSGKTIVALLAMLEALEVGLQTALMAPTGILARQHAETLSAFLKPLGIEVGLLLGGGKTKVRSEILSRIKDGSLRVVVGTHAIFQKDIEFSNLGLAVVDEQHRFGVQQRLKLAEKGKGVDILVMTATPIPRTLTLTAFGDMDVSRILEKPAGRLPVDTRLIDGTRLNDVIDGIGRQLKKDARIYWVCPLVEESEKMDIAAATQRADLLAKRFGGDKVGLVHGRLKAHAKEKVMQAFAKGEIKILVATTVIEVGVDVPEASLMVVEHSERFGLAQLHQLRGRIGRGSEKSTCLLLYQAPLGEIAKARLKMMRETEDGFVIAEEDLRLRGPGEVLGTRQSGLQFFKMADLAQDRELLYMAHDDAKVILNNDSQLDRSRGKTLRNLLYLFEKDAAVRLFRSG